MVKNTRSFCLSNPFINPIKTDQKKTEEKGVEVSFSFQFKSTVKEYWFAFCYPWSYEENKLFLNNLKESLKDNQENIYFHKETIVLTKEKRNMHVVTVTSNTWILDEKEPKFNK